MTNSRNNSSSKQLSQEDSHAPTHQERGIDKGLSGKTLSCGKNCADLLKKQNQVGQSSKMFQPFDLKGLPWSFKILARSAIWENFIVFPVQPSAVCTGATASGLLPTPVARDYKDTAKDWRNLAKYSHKKRLACTVAELEKTNGHLSIEFVEYLMGYPIGYSALSA